MNMSDYERMSKPLKPCPFCGREALMHIYGRPTGGYDYTPTCTDKSCAGRLSKRWHDINLAINAWNRRGGERMTKMSFDEEGLLKQPCLECDEAKVDSFSEKWYCNARKCKFPDYKEPLAEIAFKAYHPGQYVIDVDEDGQYHISGVGL